MAKTKARPLCPKCGKSYLRKLEPEPSGYYSYYVHKETSKPWRGMSGAVEAIINNVTGCSVEEPRLKAILAARAKLNHSVDALEKTLREYNDPLQASWDADEVRKALDELVALASEDGVKG